MGMALGGVEGGAARRAASRFARGFAGLGRGRRAPGLPRLPSSQFMMRMCMSLKVFDCVLSGSLSAFRKWVAQRSEYLRYVMPTFFHVDMVAACATGEGEVRVTTREGTIAST